VACFSNETNRAAEIVHESRSTAGAYHLARHLEGRGDINEAIQYFAKSGCYNHAIRLARQYQLDTDLLQFSIKARPSLQVDCANYFEQKGEFEKAVQLYQKGGELAKALDLCFKVGGAGRAQMFEVLSNISKELDDTASPAVVARCAEFFVEHGQYEKAVKLYITGGRYAQAIALCSERHVAITDELAEAMTPPKHENVGESTTPTQRSLTRRAPRKITCEERTEVLLELARACKKQNSFQLACKKFTQAGDRPRALKCLLKSGDTKNIIYYASVSRHRDIYILAANYLQSLDWQSGSEAAAELTKKIVEFYTKARAHEPLAAFYDAYAQMEIDEFRDYEKALGALKESRQQLEKARKMADRERRITALESRISIVSDFVEARRYEKSDPQKMADVCTALLQRHDVESVIRRVYICIELIIRFASFT
jgi:intraflagellar transport protein 140